MRIERNSVYSEEACIVCQQHKKIGIHLYTSFICHDCEREMIQTDTNEEKYRYFVHQLKQVKTSQIYS
ncbi:sigma factor G inhibitor Gin [Bacillus kexueae]|uniref:sigma factor G inhibitor Gin n=1 Tax=Aeribacillus kexueae TaxID=2078952 RepID=UPI001FAEAACA|nr:sigma factor G inhibitor Gin [Bacillus kexueae]